MKTTGSVNHLNSKLSTGIKLKESLNAATVSSEKNFYVIPERLVSDVLNIEAIAFIKIDIGAS